MNGNEWEHDPPNDHTPHTSVPGKLVRKVVIVYDDGTEALLEKTQVGHMWHKSFLNDDEIAARAARRPARYWRDHDLTWRTPRPRPVEQA